MIITIDGPAGVGKSSVASFLARERQILLLKSGSFYRALCLGIRGYLEALPISQLNNIYEGRESQENKARWQDLWRAVQTVRIFQEGEKILLNGQDVTEKLQTPELDALTPILSKLPPVRHFINQMLRRHTESHSLIAEGRDMGTVVFPEAEFKFFLDASTSVRAQRRWQQLNDEQRASLSFAELEQRICERDEIDRNKKEGALKPARSAQLIDTSNLTFEAVCQIIAGSLNNHIAPTAVNGRLNAALFNGAAGDGQARITKGTI